MKDTIATHEEIEKKIYEIVDMNFVEWEHARESLDDIIYDLKRYRSSLKTVEEYFAAGHL